MSFERLTRPWIAAAATSAVVVAGLIGAPAAHAVAGPASALAFAGYTDKTELRDEGRSVVASGELLVQDESAPAGSGTTFYVDSAGGDDDADGLSESTAWASFANVNATEFGPGDRILLKAGSVWSAEGDEVATEAYDYTTWSGGSATHVTGADPTALLAPKGSGAEGNPIVLSSYGTGPAPELNGRGVVNDVLQLTNQQHWNISNLEISNMTDGFDPTTFLPAANNGQVPGEENPQTGDVRGIHVSGENAGTLRGYDIHNVFVRDVSGVTWSVSGSGLDRSKRTGGILFEGLKGDAQTVTQFADVSVRDSFIANTAFANLTFKQFAGMGTNRYQNLPPGWGDRAAASAAPDGTLTEDPNWRPHTDIHISGNYLTNRDTQYGWDSMYLTSVQAATVEDNMIDGAGVSGIEMYYADNVVVQNNEVAELAVRRGAADSNGIDPDRGTSNILIQSNYVHDSGEGILLCGFGFSTAVVRYNVIQDIDRNYVNPHGNSGVNVIYNNLMYNTITPLKNNTVGFFESSGSASSFLSAKNPHHVINNVFVNAREDVSGAMFRTDYPGVHFNSNAYHGPKVSAPAADESAVTGDPKLGGNPADDIDNVLPTSGDSPLVVGGSDVDLAAIAPGFAATGNTGESQLPLSGDFFGRALTSPPTVGPASYVPVEGKGLIAGQVVDADGDPFPGGTVSYGSETTAVDAGGRYTIEAPAGQYQLIASAPGFADGAPVNVALAEGATVSQRLVLGETVDTTGDITGRVTSAGEGIADATVTISKGTELVATATTDAAGAFQLTDVEAGDGYTVTAGKEGFVTGSSSNVTVKAARTVTVDLVLSVDRGEAVYAVNETFDDETIGGFTATGDGGLVAKVDATAGTVSVAADPSQEGNRYLQIAKTGSGNLAVHNPVEQNLTGIVTIEARIQRTSTNGAPNQVALYSYSEDSWNASNPATSSNPAATFGFANGRLITHNVTGSGTVKNVQDYAVGQWYTVRNVANLDAGTFDFYVDDMTTPVLADQPLRTQVDDLDYFSFFSSGSNRGDMLIDYVRVNTGAPHDYDDSSLASIEVATAQGTETLEVSADGSTYSGTVDPFTKTVTLTPTAGSPFATVTVNGAEVAAGEAVEVALVDGEQEDTEFVTEVPVVVTAEDGTATTFTVSISRTNPNQSTYLRSLAVDGYELAPAFTPARQGTDEPYVVTEEVASAVSSVTIRWERGWTGQQVQVNGALVAADATETTVELAEGKNVIEVTTASYPGDFDTYLIELTRAAPSAEDAVRPSVALVSPTTAGPFSVVSVRVDATDNVGLRRVVANIYQDGKLVKSTQTAVNGATSGSHVATVTLPDGAYTVKYNAQDLAGNISQTSSFAFTIDATAPTVTVKEGDAYTLGGDGVYDRVSFKLHDVGKIDKVTVNGVVKDLSNNAWSDVNYVTPGVFGAVRGANTLVVYDVAGNTTTVTFTLN